MPDSQRTYRVGELLTLKSGAQWRVKDVHTHHDGNPGVGLVNPLNPNHGTAFYADVLDTLVVAEPRPVAYPESGDYLVGTAYTVSARGEADTESPEVWLSGAEGRPLLDVTPAEARALSTALRVAADQADADAGTDPTADDTPAWLLELAAVSSVPRRWVVTADADGKITIPKAGVWEFSTDLDAAKQRIAALYAGHRGGALEGWDGSPTMPGGGAQANRETVGKEETEQTSIAPSFGRLGEADAAQANRETVGAEESSVEEFRAMWAPGSDKPDYLTP